MKTTSTKQRDALIALGKRLLDQKAARVIVSPREAAEGFWFGGGNMVEDEDGVLHLIGRYRNAGDSTTGLSRGTRGFELALFSSDDPSGEFRKVFAFSKKDLQCQGQEVISIEGSALHRREDGYELFVSTEKNGIEYPTGLEQYRKPGTGIWSIDRIFAPTMEELRSAPVEPLLRSSDPQHLHVKDPVIHKTPTGETLLVFCTHPFNWSSSNSAWCTRSADSESFEPPRFDLLPRGNTWDVAATRVTDVLSLDGHPLGLDEAINLVFYDGAESLRQLPENPSAFSRPRGYSCEELGGLAFYRGSRITDAERLSLNLPLFLSPWGTGSSRYVHVLSGRNAVYTTWQQSQPDRSQPLVLNTVTWDEVWEILSTGRL